jgi:hypothetical protein
MSVKIDGTNGIDVAQINAPDGSPVALTIDNEGFVDATKSLKSRHRFVAINFDTLTLNVATTGSANPADPVGDGNGSGDAFDNLLSAVTWVNSRINVRALTINFGAGPHTVNGNILFQSSSAVITLKGNGQAVTINGQIQGSTELRLDNINLVFNTTNYNALLWFGSVASMSPSLIKCDTAGICVLNCERLTLIDNLMLESAARSTLLIVENLNLSGKTLTLRQNVATNFGMLLNSKCLNPGTISTPWGSKKLRAELGAAVVYGNITLADGAAWEGNTFSKAANGYIVDPKSGVITQWGSVLTAGPGDATATFPIAFPNGVFQIALAVIDSPNNISVSYNGAVKSTFSIYTRNPNMAAVNIGVSWIATGH